MSYGAAASAITPQDAMFFRRLNVQELTAQIRGDMRVAHREAAVEIGDMIGRVARGEDVPPPSMEAPPPTATGRRWQFWPSRQP
jgi:hypothetical protein